MSAVENLLGAFRFSLIYVHYSDSSYSASLVSMTLSITLRLCKKHQVYTMLYTFIATLTGMGRGVIDAFVFMAGKFHHASVFPYNQ